MVLESEPTGPVTVAVVVPGGTDVRVNPVRLTFTSGNWSEAQRVTVRAEEDEDALADGVVRLTHAVSGGDYGSETAAGGVGDDPVEKDEPELSIVDARVASEGSGGLLFEVSLNTASSKDVTVDYATADGTAGSADYTRTTGTLTFAAETTGPSDDPGCDHERRGGRSGGGAVHGGVERGGERDAGGRERDGNDRGRRRSGGGGDVRGVELQGGGRREQRGGGGGAERGPGADGGDSGNGGGGERGVLGRLQGLRHHGDVRERRDLEGSDGDGGGRPCGRRRRESDGWGWGRCRRG